MTAHIPTVRISKGLLSRLDLHTVCQKGFMARVTVGCSIRELLTAQFGVDSGYIEEHLSTIFLNHRSVDDLDGAVVTDGATLALSSAMPGLVGATLRRGGRFSPLRREITHAADLKTAAGRTPGIIVIRLFNRIMADLWHHFLEKGIILPTDGFIFLLHLHMQGGPSPDDYIEVDDRVVKIAGDGVKRALSSSAFVDLRSRHPLA